jgi:hypothetical protein
MIIDHTTMSGVNSLLARAMSTTQCRRFCVEHRLALLNRLGYHAGMARRTALDNMSFDRLLALRLCDLDVAIRGTWLEECVERLHDELAARNIVLRPHCWLSDEWFSPKESPGIAIPFYLAHPRLMALERREIYEVEGGSRTECMKLLRHETAHAIQVAYRVHQRPRWKELFGRSGAAYPDYYRPNPASRHYVQHLDGWYAQCHPDEDFAETFAVWLAPRSGWRKRYAHWPALEKLDYVDELMGRLAGERPRFRSRTQPHRLSTLRRTLRSYYDYKRERYAVDGSETFDRDLERLFTHPDQSRAGETAHAFLRRHRNEIRELVARWTGEYQFIVDHVLKQIMVRVRQLRLRAVGPRHRLKTECAILLAVHSVQALRSRKWHAV